MNVDFILACLLASIFYSDVTSEYSELNYFLHFHSNSCLHLYSSLLNFRFFFHILGIGMPLYAFTLIIHVCKLRTMYFQLLSSVH